MSVKDWIDLGSKIITVILIPLFTYYNKSINNKIDSSSEKTENLVNELRKDMQERDKKRDDEISELRKELKNLQINLPKEYVLREDFIRVTNNIENKLVDINSKIDEFIKYIKEG